MTLENKKLITEINSKKAKEMIKNDLDGAIAYSEKNMKSRARGEQMDRIADALIEQRGEQGLIDWINGIDHTVKENDMLSYKTHAIRQSVERIARNDREKAIQFIADNAQEPFVDSDTLRGLHDTLVEHQSPTKFNG